MLDTEYKIGKVHELSDQVSPAADKVQFKNIFKNDNGGVALLAFEANQVLAEHIAPAEVMVYVLEGEIEFTMIESPHTLKAGEFMLVGEGVPHSVVAKTAAVVMLVKVKSDK